MVEPASGSVFEGKKCCRNKNRKESYDTDLLSAPLCLLGNPPYSHDGCRCWFSYRMTLSNVLNGILTYHTAWDDNCCSFDFTTI